jgi:hypothetical protein
LAESRWSAGKYPAHLITVNDHGFPLTSKCWDCGVTIACTMTTRTRHWTLCSAGSVRITSFIPVSLASSYLYIGFLPWSFQLTLLRPRPMTDLQEARFPCNTSSLQKRIT